MSFSFQHSGGSLPITVPLGETTVEAPCPTCQRVGKDGIVRISAPPERTAGSTPVMCPHGHMVMVEWTRTDAEAVDG